MDESFHKFTPEEEISLFLALKDSKPAGVHRHLRMITLLDRYREITGDRSITTDDIWHLLEGYFDLKGIDEIEDELNDFSPIPFQYDKPMNINPEDMSSIQTKPKDNRGRKRVVKTNEEKSVVKPTVEKSVIKPITEKSVVKPTAEKIVAKPIAEKSVKTNAEKNAVKTTAEKSAVKSTEEKSVAKRSKTPESTTVNKPKKGRPVGRTNTTRKRKNDTNI